MTESAVLPLAYPNHFIMAERTAIIQSFHRLSDAGGVVEHAKWIHHGIETQATANAPHLVGEARTQEEQTIAIGDGLI